MKCIPLLFAAIIFVTSASAQEAPRTGSFEASASLEQIFGAAEAPDVGRALPPDKPIQFQLYVPSTYDPANPPGVFVYTSPMRHGAVPDGWEGVLDEANLIWISAEKSGNGTPDVRRMSEAIAALALVRKDYVTAPGRSYASGLSRGGQITSLLVEYFPDVFDGALFVCGAEKLEVSDEAALAKMAQRRFVFLTGTQDFARFRMRDAYQAYLDAGLENSTFMEISGMDHRNPDAEDFAEALTFLDNRSVEENP
ncbi:prolyl oligopeptidase family serine peptidase [Parvularcula flava]|uniref:Prolyl oligopeptidase family serine peptidase n=1 Tax=Aquisalinus luteolus TaxID=1566827 RepID=A0A8J3A242_9PROT|nr:prolyl oligopeptidase family serine peptidase [Aquisalinus luteolus]NHK27089.1 prolyl oligopeptidase family serine peptidase [Aquisalinus luteolus]GGH94335.1 hypothetical protein GCM10011355_08280 [Aquisalinus luteolus]